jgi:hypothetical protein
MMNRIFFEIWNDDDKKKRVRMMIMSVESFFILFILFQEMIKREERERERKKISVGLFLKFSMHVGISTYILFFSLEKMSNEYLSQIVIMITSKILLKRTD